MTEANIILNQALLRVDALGVPTFSTVLLLAYLDLVWVNIYRNNSSASTRTTVLYYCAHNNSSMTKSTVPDSRVLLIVPYPMREERQESKNRQGMIPPRSCS